MSETETFPANLQRHVLSLLVFSDKHCQLISGALPLVSWAGDTAIMALVKAVYSYIENYKTAPKEHTYDLINELNIKPDFKENLELLITASESHFDDLNIEYVLSCIDQFHRRSTLKNAIYECAEILDRGQPDSIEKVEDLLQSAMKKKHETFNKGSRLSDTVERLLLNEPEEEAKNKVMMGIEALDRRNLVPTRKQLYLVAAGSNTGKSWALGHIGKRALIENKKVLHITLEMSEDEVNKRYLQALFAASVRPQYAQTKLVIKDTGFDTETVMPCDVLTDEAYLTGLASKLDVQKFLNQNLLVKQFATGTLTMGELRAFVDALEMHENFIPDVLLVDYADLMKISSTNARLETGDIYKQLRGFAVDRNLILATASQINREGAKSTKADGTSISEDFSKVAIADCLITINQQELERELGLSRMYIAKARNAEARFEILIEQNFATGQFVLNSVELDREWQNNLKELLKQFKGD